MHWPVPVASLRRLVPDALEIDTFEGAAWLGIVPFEMAWVRPRGLPAVPRLSFFPELNVRTYVRHGEYAGVWFLSLDAASRLAVRAARRVFGLPYFDADMAIGVRDDEVSYRSRRTHAGAPPAVFDATWRPSGPRIQVAPGSLEHFLTERYRLYASATIGDMRADLRLADVHHVAWTLRPAVAEVRENTMFEAHGLPRPDDAPLLHSAGPVTVPTWLPRRIPAGRVSPSAAAGARSTHAPRSG